MGTNMLKKSTILVALIYLGICQTFGQAENTEETSSSLVESLGPENLQVISETRANLPTITSNSIYIQQIGSGNSASANIRTKNSEFNLLQNGNSNRAKIDVAGKTVIHDLVQNGNNNFLMEYGNTPNLNLERSIIQNGNDNGVVIFGSNSLTDKIILNLQGSSKTITIRNFN